VGLGSGRPAGWAAQPHLAAPQSPLRCGAIPSLLEPSRVVFVMDKRDLI
jgi:hypothetical protein